MASNEKRLVASMQICRAMLLIVLVAISTGCSRSEPEAQAKLPSDALLLNGAGATFPSVLYNRAAARLLWKIKKAYSLGIPKNKLAHAMSQTEEEHAYGEKYTIFQPNGRSFWT